MTLTEKTHLDARPGCTELGIISHHVATSQAAISPDSRIERRNSICIQGKDTTLPHAHALAENALKQNQSSYDALVCRHQLNSEHATPHSSAEQCTIAVTLAALAPMIHRTAWYSRTPKGHGALYDQQRRSVCNVYYSYTVRVSALASERFQSLSRRWSGFGIVFSDAIAIVTLIQCAGSPGCDCEKCGKMREMAGTDLAWQVVWDDTCTQNHDCTRAGRAVSRAHQWASGLYG